MRLFTYLYDKVMRWAEHEYAPRYLAVLSFAESSFFPVPPDVMLAPMTAARPAKGMSFALITTVASGSGTRDSEWRAEVVRTDESAGLATSGVIPGTTSRKLLTGRSARVGTR